VVEPVDPLNRGVLDAIDAFHDPRRQITSVLYRPTTASAVESSYESPADPTDGASSVSSDRSV
jgi:hypothetical protein